MRIVGLTGGIASGKSTVSNLFKDHGIPVVDADIVARNVLKKGTGGWRKVVAAFGEDILLENGEVDRAKLGQIVFSDPGKRQLLNRLLAPFISRGILMDILKLWIKGCSIIVLDVPLLFEAKMDKWTKPIIVVWVDPTTQLQRLMIRDGSMEEDAKSRINAQMSLDLKRSQADIVIDNTGSLEALHEQFQEVSTQITRPLTWTEFMFSRKGADGSSDSCEDSFLSRLLQIGATESSSTVNSQMEYEHKKMDDQKTMKIFRNIVFNLDDIWQMKDKLCAAVLKVLPEAGSCLQKPSSDLHIGVKNLIQMINELHLKHRSLAGTLQNHRDTDAKNKAELKCLRGNSLFLSQVNG